MMLRMVLSTVYNEDEDDNAERADNDKHDVRDDHDDRGEPDGHGKRDEHDDRNGVVCDGDGGAAIGYEGYVYRQRAAVRLSRSS